MGNASGQRPNGGTRILYWILGVMVSVNVGLVGLVYNSLSYRIDSISRTVENNRRELESRTWKIAGLTESVKNQSKQLEAIKSRLDRIDGKIDRMLERRLGSRAPSRREDFAGGATSRSTN